MARYWQHTLIDRILLIILLKTKLEAGRWGGCQVQVGVQASPRSGAVLPGLAPAQRLRHAQAALHPAEQVLLFNWDRI